MNEIQLESVLSHNFFWKTHMAKISENNCKQIYTNVLCGQWHCAKDIMLVPPTDINFTLLQSHNFFWKLTWPSFLKTAVSPFHPSNLWTTTMALCSITVTSGGNFVRVLQVQDNWASGISLVCAWVRCATHWTFCWCWYKSYNSIYCHISCSSSSDNR